MVHRLGKGLVAWLLQNKPPVSKYAARKTELNHFRKSRKKGFSQTQFFPQNCIIHERRFHWRLRMKRFHRAALVLTVVLTWALGGLAQTSTSRQTISTYVGPPLPVSGTQAITQVVDSGSSPIPDGAGGFYF